MSKEMREHIDKFKEFLLNEDKKHWEFNDDNEGWH